MFKNIYLTDMLDLDSDHGMATKAETPLQGTPGSTQLARVMIRVAAEKSAIKCLHLDTSLLRTLQQSVIIRLFND